MKKKIQIYGEFCLLMTDMNPNLFINYTQIYVNILELHANNDGDKAKLEINFQEQAQWPNVKDELDYYCSCYFVMNKLVVGGSYKILYF